HALSGIEDREVDVGADIEDAGLHRRMLVRIVEERDDLLFLARIERTGMDLAAGGLDLLDQGQELFAITAASEDGETFRGEFLGTLAADEIAGADHRDRFVSLLQGCSPALPGVEAISPALLAPVCALALRSLIRCRSRGPDPEAGSSGFALRGGQ